MAIDSVLACNLSKRLVTSFLAISSGVIWIELEIIMGARGSLPGKGLKAGQGIEVSLAQVNLSCDRKITGVHNTPALITGNLRCGHSRPPSADQNL